MSLAMKAYYETNDGHLYHFRDLIDEPRLVEHLTGEDRISFDAARILVMLDDAETWRGKLWPAGQGEDEE